MAPMHKILFIHCVHIWSNICMLVPVSENPNCLQATVASLVVQLLSQIVFHELALHISTLPSMSESPPCSLTSLSSHSALSGKIGKHAFLHCYLSFPPTWLAFDPSIFMVFTVMHSYSYVVAFDQASFITAALNIVQ